MPGAVNIVIRILLEFGPCGERGLARTAKRRDAAQPLRLNGCALYLAIRGLLYSVNQTLATALETFATETCMQFALREPE